jgi:putative ABC transport system permease protein
VRRSDIWQARAYRAVLVCYPHEFRQEYAREMCLSFVDDCRAQRSIVGLLGVWSRAISDVALEAPKERMRMWLQDVRYGLRMLRKDRLTTLTAIVVLALGIGATTTVFTLANGTLLRPLPFAEPDRLVAIDEFSPAHDPGGSGLMGMAFANYADVRPRARSVQELALFDEGQPTVRDEHGAERIDAGIATDALWSILGVQPLMGRVFTREETAPGHPLVVILSYDLWQHRYAGDRDILTRTINVSGDDATIIGVMPPGFHFPARAELWTPIRDTVSTDTRTTYSYKGLARLAPGATLDIVEREFSGLIRQVIAEHPEAEHGQTAKVRPLHVALTGDYRSSIWLLLGAVALVLLIACANVANLLLVKAAARAREMALRGALGAPRRRLVRQLLVESLLLGAFGTLAGIIVAVLALPAMFALIPVDLPAWMHFTPDFRVIAFVSAVAMSSGLVVGLLPALTASRQNLVEVLNEGGRGRTASSRQRAVRNVLIVAEVALSMLLLVGAGLLVRSFLNVTQQPLGFDAAHVITFRTSIPNTYNDNDKVNGVVSRIREQLATMPGVTAVAAGINVPMGGAWGRSLTADGHPVLSLTDAPLINHNVVTPGFFKSLGIPMIDGRDFTEADGTSPLVTIVDETLARRYWPGQSAVGKRVRFGPPGDNEPWHTIIGVVGVIHSQSLIGKERWDVYLPHRERHITAMRYVIRTSGDPAMVLPLVRSRVNAVDRGIAITGLRRLDAMVADSVWRPRFFTILVAVFAAVALTMALVGLYGMVSHSVSQRKHELGVRAALGASAGALRWMITAQSLRLVLLGIVMGGAASLALRRTLATYLFQTSATDPWMLGGTAGALALVAALASYWPARHATRVDPVTVLHE